MSVSALFLTNCKWKSIWKPCVLFDRYYLSWLSVTVAVSLWHTAVDEHKDENAQSVSPYTPQLYKGSPNWKSVLFMSNISARHMANHLYQCSSFSFLATSNQFMGTKREMYWNKNGASRLVSLLSWNWASKWKFCVLHDKALAFTRIWCLLHGTFLLWDAAQCRGSFFF